eukprot:CAMPEP_0119355732 /NCGR_PEP_ID=MMETSP1334-20130426/4531_1 /TAXON_ID=127549 /ORGANISM="Calcidiscus leptoporus, Strain RCC1130" /LENGTH=315 /DNA_ID=CAMNT_0007369635 /DNA_START=9 /DNA_END=956 /DNA_ORIENTATION=+
MLRRALVVTFLCSPAQPLSRSTLLPRTGIPRPATQLVLRGVHARARAHARVRVQHARRQRAAPPAMFGGPSGGFLNLGAPEVIVIGAVAWALLGPKELYRLAREAGSFLGEWQQLGRQAQSTFTDALEREMAEDAAKGEDTSKVGSITSKLREEASSALDTLRESMAPVQDYYENGGATRKEVPTLDEYTAANTLTEPPTKPPPEVLKQLEETLGKPEENRANFLEQISGETNQRVLDADGVTGSLSVQSAEEALIDTQIEEAENQLAMLRAEAQVLSLRRAQQESNAQRARQREEERAAEQRGAGEAEESAEMK